VPFFHCDTTTLGRSHCPGLMCGTMSLAGTTRVAVITAGSQSDLNECLSVCGRPSVRPDDVP